MSEQERKVLQHLIQFVSDHKKSFMDRVLAQRTRHITLVLEDIYQSQNASAAVRTCECLGLQDIHIIEDSAQYSVNKRVLKGSNKWIDIHRYHQKNSNNAEDCFKRLKEKGYQLLVTDPSPDGISIDDVAVDQKLAIVMGNELRGHSQDALKHADQKIFIPMFGFTESFNISVSAAICLKVILTKLRTSEVEWHLTDDEKQALLLQWVRKSVRNSSILEREFLKTIE